MLGLNPVGPMGITKFGSFDFPLGMQADRCKGNVDPGPHLPLLEEWYGKMGTPPRQQGWPCIVEDQPGVEDPKVAPWIDMLIHNHKPACVFHTGRLSGDMALELADNAHNSVVTVHAVPYKAGNAVRLYNRNQPLQPVPAQPTSSPDVWFWHSTSELIYTLKATFTPGEVGLTQGEVYRLLVEWEFYHTIPATGRKHLEPFAGFDDSITFKVIGEMTP